MAIEIRKIIDKSGLKDFVRFKISHYKGNEFNVPPLFYDELATLNKEKNPAFEHCEADYFVALKDGKIVGRIAVIINYKANEIWKQKRARFGFMDFIDDDEVVDKLFGVVESWARLRGMKEIVGPMGFTDFDHEGLLVDGYDQLATMVAEYHYPYYKTQFERIGYKKDQDWHEFLIPIPDGVPARHARLVEVLKDRFNLTVKHFENKKEVWKYAKEIFQLLNTAYKDLYGFVPLTDKQIDYYVNMYIPMLRLEFLSVVMRLEDNKIVGVGIGLPSLSRAMQKANGRFLPTGWFHMLRALKGNGNKVLDLLLIGIHPDYQGKGINALIFNQFIPEANRLGFEVAESNPELETNHKVQSMWEGLGAKHHRTRRAYLKKL